MLCSHTVRAAPRGDKPSAAQRERRALQSRPPSGGSAAARRKQRHADDLIELRLVSMPANPCAGPIFVDEDWRKRPPGGRTSQRPCVCREMKKRRKRRRLNDSTTVIVIAVAEAHHLAVRQIAMKVERLERQSGKFARERLLLFADRTSG